MLFLELSAQLQKRKKNGRKKQRQTKNRLATLIIRFSEIKLHAISTKLFVKMLTLTGNLLLTQKEHKKKTKKFVADNI